jgi:signal transduction histidine kinase
MSPKEQSQENPVHDRWIDLKVVAAMRTMLAATTLLVTLIDPSEPGRYVPLAYVTLALYTIYSAVVLLLALYRSEMIPTGIMHWLDVAWYLTLIAFSSGTNSLFFNFFFFAILAGSFGWGMKTGLRLTIASASLFTIIGIITAASDPHFELNRFLLRSIQLLVLGYMISRWGGFKINLKNQLQMLKDVTVVSNPRFGIDRTLSAILEQLRKFYDADGCLLLMLQGSDHERSYQMYRVRRDVHSTGAAAPLIGDQDAQLFLPELKDAAIIYRDNGKGKAKASIFHLKTRQLRPINPERAITVASALDADNFLCIPVVRRNETIGCLYILGTLQTFDPSAMDFLLQVMDHVTVLMENVRLVDNLASDAAEQERRRIARDIHDSVIQPYLGLQLGIAALAQKLQTGNTNVLENVEELLDLTNQELAELRRYVWGLRAPEERRNVLLPSIHRYAARFTSVTGIKVEVTAKGKIQLNDRLAAELFQIVAEGLSNVRRHALCDDASVLLDCHEGKIFVEIKNRRPQLVTTAGAGSNGNAEQRMFRPRSIAERAELLGGKTEVLVDENNYTVVRVSIPL